MRPIHLDRILTGIATLIGVVALVLHQPADLEVAAVALLATVVSHP